MKNNTSAEENKKLYSYLIEEVFNRGNMERLDEILSPEYVLRDSPFGTPKGPEAIRQARASFQSAFPDFQISLDQLIGEGEWVVARATTRGTHQGEIFGIPPTGRSFVMTGLTLVRISAGQIQESYVKNDLFGLIQQLKGQLKSE